MMCANILLSGREWVPPDREDRMTRTYATATVIYLGGSRATQQIVAGAEALLAQEAAKVTA